VERKGRYVPAIGDEDIFLWLQAGDAYEMDREMQKHYQHSVPKDTKQVGQVKMRRIVLVFRYGTEQYYNRDTGRQLETLHSRDVSLRYCIGRVPGLEEGMVYSRTLLLEMRAHWYVLCLMLMADFILTISCTK
jgi:hypothetical protein